MKIVTTKFITRLRKKYKVWKEGMTKEEIYRWGFEDKPDYYWKEADSYIWLDPLKIYVWCISKNFIENYGKAQT